MALRVAVRSNIRPQVVNGLTSIGGRVLSPGSRWAEPGDTNVVSRKFRPKLAGTYSATDGTISVNGGSWGASAAYTKGDYLLVRRDAHATLYDTPVEATVTGDGGDGYSAVYTVTTIAEPSVDGFPYTLPMTL